jgi:K+-transporting ATPase c subunit
MLSELRPAIVMLALFTALTGFAYPLAITGVASLVFSEQANGGMIARNGVIVGSSLIGQNFVSDRYFHGRPSAPIPPTPARASTRLTTPRTRRVPTSGRRRRSWSTASMRRSRPNLRRAASTSSRQTP